VAQQCSHGANITSVPPREEGRSHPAPTPKFDDFMGFPFVTSRPARQPIMSNFPFFPHYMDFSLSSKYRKTKNAAINTWASRKT
jgi:hypothetical protein